MLLFFRNFRSPLFYQERLKELGFVDIEIQTIHLEMPFFLVTARRGRMTDCVRLAPAPAAVGGRVIMSSEKPSYPGARMVGKFFGLLEIDVTEAVRHPGACDHLRRGDLHGVLGSSRLRARCSGRSGRPPRAPRPSLLEDVVSAGVSVVVLRPEPQSRPADLREYFREAARVSRALATVVSARRSGSPITLRGSCRNWTTAGRSLPAPGPEPGSQYMFTTLRAHLEGGYIPPHCDNEQADPAFVPASSHAGRASRCFRSCWL